MNVTRRYEPYQRNVVCQQEFKSPRRNRGKPCLEVKRTGAGKVYQDKHLKKASPSSSECRIGNYIVFQSEATNCLAKAIRVNTGEEYSCLRVESSKYRDTVTPYFLVGSHEHVNQVVDILFTKQYVYLMFEKSYGDLHSYIRSKRRLKEDEASRLFKQIVEAVCHSHNTGVVIRDLKLRKFVFKDAER